jgi:hypothetical protein
VNSPESVARRRVESLKADAVITYMPSVDAVGPRPQSLRARAHFAYILSSGWLRVTWLDGSTTLVSPAAVREVSGKGVEYA